MLSGLQLYVGPNDIIDDTTFASITSYDDLTNSILAELNPSVHFEGQVYTHLVARSRYKGDKTASLFSGNQVVCGVNLVKLENPSALMHNIMLTEPDVGFVAILKIVIDDKHHLLNAIKLADGLKEKCTLLLLLVRQYVKPWMLICAAFVGVALFSALLVRVAGLPAIYNIVLVPAITAAFLTVIAIMHFIKHY